MHMRTDVAKKYLDAIDKPIQTVVENGIEYIYDTGSFLYKQACLVDQLTCHEISMGYYVTHYMGFSHWADKKPEALAKMYQDNVERQRIVIHNLLSNKIWEKLKPPLGTAQNI